MNKFSNSFLIRSVIIMVIAVTLVNIFLWEEINNHNISDIKRTAHLNAKSALGIIDSTSFYFRDKVQLEKDAAAIKKLTNLRTTLIGREGNVIGDSEIPINKLDSLPNQITQPEVMEALYSNLGFVKRENSVSGLDYYYYCAPVKYNDKITGFLRLRLSASDFEEQRNFFIYMVIIVDIIFLLFAVLFLVSTKNLFNKKITPLYTNLIKRKSQKKYNALPESPFLPVNDIVYLINQIFENFNSEKEFWQRENNHLLHIIDSLNEGIAVFHSDGLLSFSNNRFVKILDISPDFDKNGHAYNILKFPPLLNDIQKYNKKKSAIIREIKYYEDKYLKYKINPFKFGKDDLGFIIVIRDITKIHNLETMRTDFVANVSHEFKTPLTSIRGYSETLLAGSVKDEETKFRFLEKIRTQSVYLENLVTDLLQLARIESKEIENIERINIVPIIKNIASEFGRISNAKKIRFNFNNNIENDCFVNANTKVIYNIAANLLSNAIQYSKENGNISLTVKEENDIIRIEVSDDGIGIPDSDKSRIFERFFRVKKASAIYAEGSGLGLSIVKNAVELLSGTFGFESEENVGSLFWVELKTIK